MTPDDVFVKDLETFLDRRAGTAHAGYLSETLERTSSASQRRWWSSPERWLPMDLTMRRPLVARADRRTVALLVVLALIVGAIAAYAVGSRHQLPPPFGLARNGEVVVGADGDLTILDPVSGSRRTIVGGPTFDFGPVFARDGTKLLFLRGAPNDCGADDCGLYLMVADIDGTGVRQLSPGTPLLDWVDWSPDGTQIAFEGPRPNMAGHAIRVVDVDGSRLHTLDVGRGAHEVTWRAGAKPEIIFRSEHDSAIDPAPGLFAVHPDGTGLRELSPTPPQDAADYQGLAVSLDGNLVAYTITDLDERSQIHVLDLRTRTDLKLPAPEGTAQEGAEFSPDARAIVYRRHLPGDRVQLVVAPVDGSMTGLAIGPAIPRADGEGIGAYGFTPDGTAVFATYDNDKTARLLPVDGSTPTVLGSGELALVNIQRLAP